MNRPTAAVPGPPFDKQVRAAATPAGLSPPGGAQPVQRILDRFVAACAADERVLAAFLTGSYATGTADGHSDLDLGLVTADGAYEEFMAQREAFVRQLGEPVFLEQFESPHTLFFVLADGTEGELAIGREGAFRHVARGPYRVLLDKRGLLAGAAFVGQQPDHEQQREALRRQIVWFWHDLSHFIAAVDRGWLWWAFGQLEVLRRVCVNLARLRHDFLDGDVGTECYFKVEQALSAEHLAPLQQTICPMEPQAMVQAALAIVRWYQQLALPLARAHGLDYPHALEGLTLARLRPVEYGLAEVIW